MNTNNLPDFPTWKRETLDQFATDAYLKLQEQHGVIEQLRGDLRDALEQCRKLMRAPA